MIKEILLLTSSVTISIFLSYINILTKSNYLNLDNCYDCEKDCKDFKKMNIEMPEKEHKKKIKIILK